jgi:flagellar protein FliJ
MPFRFRFETLSRVRKIRQDMALQEFSRAQMQVLGLESKKGLALEQKAASIGELILKMDAGISSDEVSSYDHYFSFLEKEVELLDRQIAQARKHLEEKRQELIKKQRDYKAIERLRELDLERYETNESRLEMRFINEIAVQRHGRVR